MSAVTKGTIKTFDVDFAHCDCKGTPNKKICMMVIPIKWKRTDKSPNGRVRFTCMRCKTSWSMNNISKAGSGIALDANHPEERARRKAIHPDYDHAVAVNIHTGRRDPNQWSPEQMPEWRNESNCLS
jgi:hypothetical protein